MKWTLPICVLIMVTMVGVVKSQRAESIYTTLVEKDCKKLSGRTGDGIVYAAECEGVGGFKIVHLASEHSSIFDLVDPAARDIELNIRSVMGTAAPSMLGDKVEWRIKRNKGKVEPYALIVRVNVFNDPDNSTKRESNLVVVKINADSACVTDIVAPTVKGQNAEARRLADVAAARPCLDPK